MSDNPFYKLSPFIQEYIYNNKWETLRDIQVAACDVIFNTEQNLLLSSGTASGKTEAAFLPCLTKIEEDPPKSVGILYISPLKALINDQFIRLDDLLQQANIKVTKWHGDVSQSDKHKLVKNPCGVLQITPESLEGMLMHRKMVAIKLFSDLRYIIIDEVHYFMGCARGVQLLCILERIKRLTGNNPRRIGLSATLGDYTIAENWLDTGSHRGVLTPKISKSGQKIKLAVEHFTLLHPEAKDGDLSTIDREYFDFIYNNTYGKRSIIFSDVKMELERIISTLKELSEEKHDEDVFFVHHGSLSSTLRETAETVMKEGIYPAVTGATVTLELGIDLGSLERVMQLGSPFSVSSFVQRLGRSGRRGTASEMWFACKEWQHSQTENVFQSIDWDFIRCIAIIQLYVEERFIEPISLPKKPFGLVYHQTMSELTSLGEASPAYLAQRVLTLEPFKHITQSEYKELLENMLLINHIEKNERGGLYIGVNAEHIINDYQFLAVFDTLDIMSVRYDSEEIGSVEVKFPVGERFALAGHTWEVTEIDEKNNILYVIPIKGRSNNIWAGKGFLVHTKVLQKMYEIMSCEKDYGYLHNNAIKTLSEIRTKSKMSGINDYTILKLGGNDYCILPWLGTRAFLTLLFALGERRISVVNKHVPYWVVVRTKKPIEEIYDILWDIKKSVNNPIYEIDEPEKEEKFQQYVPLPLKKVQFNEDFLDLEDVRTNLNIN